MQAKLTLHEATDNDAKALISLMEELGYLLSESLTGFTHGQKHGIKNHHNQGKS